MFSWFVLKDAEGNTNPLYTGYERLSNDGLSFIMHDELAVARGAELAEEEQALVLEEVGAPVGKGDLILDGGNETGIEVPVGPVQFLKATRTFSIDATKTLMDSVEWAAIPESVEEPLIVKE